MDEQPKTEGVEVPITWPIVLPVTGPINEIRPGAIRVDIPL